MPGAGGHPSTGKDLAADRPDRSLVALWLVLPACAWWIGFGADWARAGSSRWVWWPVAGTLGLWLLWTVWRVSLRSRRNGDVASASREDPADASRHAHSDTPSPHDDGRRRSPAGPGAFAHLLAGAGFLYVLGPGILPIRHAGARALLAVVIYTFAWAGWTALHPGARHLAGRVLVRVVGRHLLDEPARSPEGQE